MWGPVAKPVTATLVVLMAQRGELDLDAPVTTYLPDFATADRSRSDRITVRHLLDHTSGIPARYDLTDRYDRSRRPGDVVALLAEQDLEGEVGEEHVYSSLNYMLLAAVVEEATGRAYADVLTERVLAPAGMTTAITRADDAEERLPPGHRYVFGAARPFTTQVDPAGISSGYLAGSLEDAIAFAQVNLEGGPLLTDRQRDQLTAPEVSTGPDATYGLGWRTSPVLGSDDTMHWHSGAAPGFQTSIILLPEQDRAVVVLQNVYGSFQESELLDTAWGLASLVSGAEPERHDGDVLYVVVLAGLSTIVAVLLGLLGWSVRRWSRRDAPLRRRPSARLVGWLIGLGLAAAVLLSLPAYFGVALGQLWLWAPDLAALVHAALVLVAALALTRTAMWLARTPT